jgi:hypothetical protein
MSIMQASRVALSCQTKTWQPLCWANIILRSFWLCAVTHACNRRCWLQVSRLCLAEATTDPSFHWWMWRQRRFLKRAAAAALQTTLLSKWPASERWAEASHTETCDDSSLILCKEPTKFRTAAAPSIFKQHGLCGEHFGWVKRVAVWDRRCDETTSKGVCSWLRADGMVTLPLLLSSWGKRGG